MDGFGCDFTWILMLIFFLLLFAFPSAYIQSTTNNNNKYLNHEAVREPLFYIIFLLTSCICRVFRFEKFFF